MLVEELENFNKKWKLCWSQAKDDVGPKDIFRLYKGSPEDRAIVAKYCIKDCKLVSLLINKLEVVTKNIEMANVCYVPLSYLFIRGQGVKLFSLCLKEFRKQKYIFPVIKLNKLYKCKDCEYEFLDKWDCPNCKSKNKSEIETESSTYEGAIVFDPVPKVEYEAVATKDYASLTSTFLLERTSHCDDQRHCEPTGYQVGSLGPLGQSGSGGRAGHGPHGVAAHLECAHSHRSVHFK